MAGYGVSVELNGQRRTLRYDLAALRLLEKKLGITMSQLEDYPAGMEFVSVALWAGLLHEDAELKQEDVDRWVGPGGLPLTEAIAKVGEGLEEAFGAGNPTEAIAAEPSGTGANSGGLGSEPWD